MDGDPTTLESVTAALTVLAAFSAAVFASRSARAAQETLSAQTRPLLTEVLRRPGTPGHEVMLPDGPRVVGEGEIVENLDESWLSIPVQNLGRGIAVIEACRAEALVSDFELPRGAVRRPHVEPGAQTRLLLWVSPVSEYLPRVQEAIRHGAGVIVHLAYSDVAGRQRQVISAQLERRGNGPWYVDHFWTRDVAHGWGENSSRRWRPRMRQRRR